jgi:RNA polymerase sigma factor (TIGR02999 family)
MNSAEPITNLLVKWREGDQAALEELMPLVYGELRRLAARHLRRERAGHTLQATALVHEAYLRLLGERGVSWQNRAHFYAIAARRMRHILVEHARSRDAAKRGGGKYKLSLSKVDRFAPRGDVNLLALDEALERLEEIDPQKSRIIELRYFGGLTIEDTAEVLGISPATVKREWSMARAWLRRDISNE